MVKQRKNKLWEVIIEIAKAVRCFKYCFFSIIGNGFGLLLGLFFIAVFVLLYHMKLHVLNESKSKKSLVKALIHTIVCLFVTIMFLSSIVHIYDEETFISHGLESESNTFQITDSDPTKTPRSTTLEFIPPPPCTPPTTFYTRSMEK